MELTIDSTKNLDVLGSDNLHSVDGQNVNGNNESSTEIEIDKIGSTISTVLSNGNHESNDDAASTDSEMTRRLRRRNSPFTLKSIMVKKANREYPNCLTKRRRSKQKAETISANRQENGKVKKLANSYCKIDEVVNLVLKSGQDQVSNAVYNCDQSGSIVANGNLDIAYVENERSDLVAQDHLHQLMEVKNEVPLVDGINRIEELLPEEGNVSEIVDSIPNTEALYAVSSTPARAGNSNGSMDLNLKKRDLFLEKKPQMGKRAKIRGPKPKSSSRLLRMISPSRALPCNSGILLTVGQNGDVAQQVSSTVCSMSGNINFCLKNGTDHVPAFKILDDTCSFICSMCDRHMHNTTPSFVIIRIPTCGRCASECNVAVNTTGDEETTNH